LKYTHDQQKRILLGVKVSDRTAFCPPIGWHYFVQSLAGPFFRPGPHDDAPVTRSGGQGRPTWGPPGGLVLDGRTHDRARSWSDAWLGRQIGRGRCDGLNSWFFLIGDDRHRLEFLRRAAGVHQLDQLPTELRGVGSSRLRHRDPFWISSWRKHRTRVLG
jgi:hypothetical protein